MNKFLALITLFIINLNAANESFSISSTLPSIDQKIEQFKPKIELDNSKNYIVINKTLLTKEYKNIIELEESRNIIELTKEYFNPYRNKIQPSFAQIDEEKLKQYKIFGKKYKLIKPEIGKEYDGVASWYGGNFHGKETTSGEKYNKFLYTAAHKTLPLGTIVEVFSEKTNKTVVVKINDRGPFVGNRIIDLSYAAAKKLSVTGLGTYKVKLRILGMLKK